MIAICTCIILCLLFKKRFDVTTIVALAISIINGVYIFSASGNAIRTFRSVSIAMPDFDNISLINKIYMTFGHTMNHFLLSYDPIFLLFVILLALAVFIYESKWYYRLMGTAPFVFYFFAISSFSKKCLILFGRQVPINASNADTMKNYLHLMISIFILGCIFSTLYLIFTNMKEYLLNIGILLLGFATRMAMAFSPTMYISHDRTIIFLYFAIIIVMLHILMKEEIRILLSNKWIYGALGAFVVAHVCVFFYYVTIYDGQIPKWIN